ncbi:MAG: NIL domain-containing protein [Rhizonema sp. PD37]|nr:NIL domain-containing protein [Rhizonema sp. PD37]
MISTTVNPALGYIHIRVPQQYLRQPVVSRLISRYNLIINITAAFLEPHTAKDGWFHLEIQGNSQQIEAGFAYLETLNVEIVQLQITSCVKESMENLKSNFNYSYSQEEQRVYLSEGEGQTTRAKFQVCIPKMYRTSPIITRLVSCYGLTVNITGASLNSKTEDGWFDLELWGRRQQIVDGLRYLRELGLQIWLSSRQETLLN